MGNAAGGMDVSPGREVKGPKSSFSPGSLKQPHVPKLPLPPDEELEERFSLVLVSGTRQCDAQYCTAKETTLPYEVFQTENIFTEKKYTQHHRRVT